MRLAGSRLTKDGVIVITAQSRRTQADNRADAIEQLVSMVAEAAESRNGGSRRAFPQARKPGASTPKPAAGR